MTSPFDAIYAANAWNGTDSLSGPGSGWSATRQVARELEALVLLLNVESVVNAACGDDLWTPDLPGYLGVDVSSIAIGRARAFHPDRRYQVGDVRISVPPAGLVLLRDAMQHVPLADGLAVLRAVRASGSAWLLASTYKAPSARHQGGINVDVRTGEYYCPDLSRSPFALGRPLQVIRDGWDYQDPNRLADPVKFLGLWRIP